VLPKLANRLQHKGNNLDYFLLRTGLEVCMGVGNPMGIPFPWDGNGNSHDGNGNGNGNKANGNGNGIAYISRV